MKPWISVVIFTSIFSVLFGVVAGYHYIEYRQQEQSAHELTVYLINCKTDDLDEDTFASHFSTNYKDYYSKQDLDTLRNEFSPILRSNPDAKLFHYNTPEKIWRQLGGRKGYAILLKSKIVWDRRLKIS